MLHAVVDKQTVLPPTSKFKYKQCRIDRRTDRKTDKQTNISPILYHFLVQAASTENVPVPNRARQLYKNISMLFLFPVKDGKLSTSVIAIFNASCYG